MINVLLKGLTGPVNGKDYVALMVPMESNDDAWFASVASYVRTSFGNQSSLVDTNDVARLRAANLARTQPWTAETLRGSLPQPLANRKDWRLSASHNPAAAPLAADGKLRRTVQGFMVSPSAVASLRWRSSKVRNSFASKCSAVATWRVSNARCPSAFVWADDRRSAA